MSSEPCSGRLNRTLESVFFVGGDLLNRGGDSRGGNDNGSGSIGFGFEGALLNRDGSSGSLRDSVSVGGRRIVGMEYSFGKV